jgi:hypothetical protein
MKLLADFIVFSSLPCILVMRKRLQYSKKYGYVKQRKYTL